MLVIFLAPVKAHEYDLISIIHHQHQTVNGVFWVWEGIQNKGELQ